MATLEVRRLTKRYRRVPVVNEVSFTVHSSEITGYLGPNGSGESTTVKMLTGLVEPSNVEILLNGTHNPAVASLLKLHRFTWNSHCGRGL